MLCICLPFGLSDKNGHRNDRTSAAVETGRNTKFRMPKQGGLPLRDDSDYVRENERNDQHFTVDDDYDDDEYYDGEPNESKKKKNDKANGKGSDNTDDGDEDDVQQSPEIVEQAQSARTQIIQRPKELSEAEIAALLQAASSQSPSADVEAPAATATTTTTATEMCPTECSCLNDFMTCTRPHLKHLPKVPQFIQSL